MRLSFKPSASAHPARVTSRAMPPLAAFGLAASLAASLAACSHAPPPAPPAPAPAPVVDLGPIPVAKACAKPDEKAAFDVTGLKTRLMVAALSCGSEAKYNTFMRDNKRDLVRQEGKLSEYFSRAYGRGRVGQTQLDSYKTELANVQQQVRSRDGQFCALSDSLFDKAITGKGADRISVLASSTPIAQPVIVPTCN